MSKQYLTYTYRIYPNKEQKQLIDLTFCMCREMYNTILKMKANLYKAFAKYVEECNKMGIEISNKNFAKKHHLLSISKLKENNENYKKVDSLALTSEEKNIMQAFEKFYSGACKFPKAKRRNDKNSYTTYYVNNNIRIEGKKIRLPKVKFVKAKIHRDLPVGSKIKKAVVKEDKCGKYYVALIIEVDKKNIKENEHKMDIVGLDFKVSNVFVTNEGKKPFFPKPYVSMLGKIKKQERKIARRRKFSKGYDKMIVKLRKIHLKIANIRKDYLHKLSDWIKKMYQNVVMEDISMQEMAIELGNGTNIYDTSYERFREMLKYKIEGNIIKVDMWFPSSKMCSQCGNIKKELKLGDSVYQCDMCGLTIDRDWNAAINIKEEGMRIIKLQNFQKHP